MSGTLTTALYPPALRSYRLECLSRSSIVSTGLCTRYTRRPLKRGTMFTAVPTSLSDTDNSQNKIQTQQPCSNPSKYPERLRKARTQKYGDLQAFCKLQKPLAKYLSALAWRRSRVRVSSGSLLKFAYLCGIRSTSRRKSNLPFTVTRQLSGNHQSHYLLDSLILANVLLALNPPRHA